MIDGYQRVYAEVNLDAVRSNLEHMKEHIAPGTKILGVIKTDGYGHGAIPIAKELEDMPYMYGFATATPEEAFILRQSGITKPLLILGYSFPYSFQRMIEEEIRITVFRYDMLEQISDAVQNLSRKGINKKARVHIKVDTGMSRIGIRPDEEGLLFVKKAFETDEVEVEGIFTHFARSDESDKSSANEQLDKFMAFIEKIRKELGREIPIKHCANSAAILEMPDTHMDVVRAGIIMYGLWPSEEVNKDIMPLQPALSLYSCIVYKKMIEPGCSVSYGGTFTADKKMIIATVPTGYGDGYPRGLSGTGYVLVKGKKAPILGRVCMDQFMIDVTHIPEVKEGDKVTLIGCDGEEKITMEELGDISGRFNYELACDLGKRIPRVYTKGGEILNTKDYHQDF